MKHWKTTLSGIGAALMSALAGLAALPYQLGDVATIIPPEWKARVVMVSLCAAFALRVVQSVTAADAAVKPVTGIRRVRNGG